MGRESVSKNLQRLESPSLQTGSRVVVSSASYHIGRYGYDQTRLSTKDKYMFILVEELVITLDRGTIPIDIENAT